MLKKILNLAIIYLQLESRSGSVGLTRGNWSIPSFLLKKKTVCYTI